MIEINSVLDDKQSKAKLKLIQNYKAGVIFWHLQAKLQQL